MSAAASINHRVDPLSVARRVAYMAAVRSKTRSASGLLNRNISAATGVSMTTAPARRPAAGPNHLRTPTKTMATEATPSSACGTSMLHWLKPKICAEISITHRKAGDLSTVMKLDASREPKKKAVQLRVPAWTAAA